MLADLKPGQTLDARQRMQRITMRVILSAVFGLHEGERCRRLEALLHTSLELRAGRLGSLLLFVPLLRMEDESQALLMACRDENGQGLSDAELHDELLTLLMAGHETTGSTGCASSFWPS